MFCLYSRKAICNDNKQYYLAFTFRSDSFSIITKSLKKSIFAIDQIDVPIEVFQFYQHFTSTCYWVCGWVTFDTHKVIIAAGFYSEVIV